MDYINRKFSNKYRSPWVKVKFTNDQPDQKARKQIKNIKFCEAIKEAVTEPIILEKDSISCIGAQYAFGWNSNDKKLLKTCQTKTDAPKSNLRSIVNESACLKKGFKYIALNTKGIADLIISYTTPEEIMNLIKTYQNITGKILDISLNSTMSICSGVAVKTYLENKITISFGCNDSRNFANLDKHTLAIGIPRNMWNIFIE